MRAAEGLVVFKGTKLAESAAAYKFRVVFFGNQQLEEPIETWFPMSQTKSVYKDPNSTDNDTITVTEWIAKQKGFIS